MCKDKNSERKREKGTNKFKEEKKSEKNSKRRQPKLVRQNSNESETIKMMGENRDRVIPYSFTITKYYLFPRVIPEEAPRRGKFSDIPSPFLILSSSTSQKTKLRGDQGYIYILGDSAKLVC